MNTDQNSPPLATGSPGKLQINVTLTIETREAQRLFTGHKDRKRFHLGLRQFSTMLRPIWHASARDDPYADWFLFQIHSAFEEARKSIAQSETSMASILDAVRGIDVHIANSTAPLSVPLNFATPFGYMGAYLVADYDALIRAAFTASRIGLLSRHEMHSLAVRQGRPIRKAFALARGWRNCAITRTDVRRGTARASAAESAMGCLPDRFRDRTQRPAHAPAIQSTWSRIQ